MVSCRQGGGLPTRGVDRDEFDQNGFDQNGFEAPPMVIVAVHPGEINVQSLGYIHPLEFVS